MGEYLLTMPIKGLTLPQPMNKIRSSGRARNRLPLGLRFSHPELLEGALTHPSYRNEYSTAHLPDFDRLEFFGDAILNYVVCRELLNRFPQANEGILSRFRSTLVSRKILARVAREIKLEQWIRLGRGLAEEKRKRESKVLADTLEAVIAAIHEDGGLSRAVEFILKNFHSYLNPRRLFRLDPNPKSTLQEVAQKVWGKLPEYSWKATPQGLRVEVRIAGKHKLAVRGKNRRALEEKAACELLKRLRRLSDSVKIKKIL